VMTGTAPAPATKTTLRVPPRVFLIGRSYKDAAELMQLLIVEGYMPIADLKLDDALTKLRSAKFEFVLLDIDVAGAAAQKFIETLRGDEQLAGIPVLVISPSNDMEAIERSPGGHMTSPASNDPDQIKAEIDATREQLARTVNSWRTA